jgi:hypothetical protein
LRATRPACFEALRLLLKGEGIEVETAHSPGETRELDVILMDLSYTRDTT